MRDHTLIVALVLFALAAACGGGGTDEPVGTCGNLVVEPGEECDEGPFGTDTCTNACRRPVAEPENCSDGVDKDRDELIDCDDPDCDGTFSCRPPPEICDDGVDNDRDGLVDCDDPDCARNLRACPIPEDEICDDDVDNDLDGDTDCDDDDCLGNPACPEICNDGIDNDGDGWIDCLDFGCAATRSCPPACGDRRVDPGEECDLGPGNSDDAPDTCRTNCRLPRCGDGVVDGGEECDTGASIGSPGPCWEGCVLEPEPAGCEDAVLLDIGALGRRTPSGGFVYTVGSRITEPPGSRLRPPASCSAEDFDDVLLRFVPEQSGWFVITTAGAGTSVDTILYVYTGDCSRAPVACNDNDGDLTTSRVYVSGTAGEPMYIAVEGRTWGRIQVTAERASELVGLNQECSVSGWSRVCEEGLRCDAERAPPVCVPPTGSCSVPVDVTRLLETVFEPTVTIGANTAAFDDANAGSCGGDTGPEYVGVLRGVEPRARVEFRVLEPEGAVGYIRTACNDGASELACAGVDEPMTAELALGDTMYLVVESPSAIGGFVSAQVEVLPIRAEGALCDPAGVLSVCAEPFFCGARSGVCERHLGLDCANPFDVNRFADYDAPTRRRTWTMNTDVAANFATSCGGTGGDLVARFVPTVTGNVTLLANAAGAAPALAASRSCNAAATEIACSRGGGGVTRIDFAVEAGVPVFLTVEALTPLVEGDVSLTLIETPLGGEGAACDPTGVSARCATGRTCVELDGRAECRAVPANSCTQPHRVDGLRETPTNVELTGSISVDYLGTCGVGGTNAIAVTPAVSGVLVATMTTPGARRDATLWARSDCDARGSQLQCVQDADAGIPKLDLPVSAGQTVYLHAGGISTATVSLRVLPVAGLGQACDPTGATSRCGAGLACVASVCTDVLYGACDSPISLVRGDGSLYGAGVTFPIDTNAGGARSLASCGGSGAADLVGEFVAPSDGMLTVSYTASELRGVLSMRSSCGDITTELGCARADAARGTATLSRDLEQGERVWLWFDAVGGSSTRAVTTGSVRVRFASTATPACDNTIRDGGEADVDCGGPSCAACATGRACYHDGDCASDACVGGVCSPHAACANNLRDGDETGVDCGGSCAPCANGLGCGINRDCFSRICTTGTCRRNTCSDGIAGAFETDIDCGGPSCGPCAIGRSCRAHTDCVTATCNAEFLVCAAPSCSDGVRNGTEVAPDCGGTCGGEPCLVECEPDQDWIDANLFYTAFDRWMVMTIDGSPFHLGEVSRFEPRTTSCAIGFGPSGEAVHRFQAPRDGSYTFSTAIPSITTTANTVLYLRANSCRSDSTEVACNDDASPTERRSTLTHSMRAGEVVFVVVDGFGPADSGGSYVLMISPP